MTKRKDGRWQAIIVIDGQKHCFYGKTQSEVYKKIAAYKEKAAAGRTFAEVAEEWADEHYQRVEYSTAKGYRASVKRAVDEWADVPIKDIAAQDVMRLINRLVAQKYGKKVISTQLNVLNMIFNYAIIAGDIEYNPRTAVKIPSGLASQRREIPSDAELQKVKNSDWLLPYFLLMTGCRRGEALALRYEDIDFDKRVIHITKSVGYKGNFPYIKTPKTAAGSRDIILLTPLAARLPKRKTGLVFPSETGGIYKESQYKVAWQKWQRENGLNITAHQLRHAFATMLFEADISVKDAQAQLGHANIAMTQDIYTHIRVQRQNDIRAKMDAYVESMS